jgi:hypothetical protein
MFMHEVGNGESAEPYLKRRNTFYNIIILCTETNMNSFSEISYLTVCPSRLYFQPKMPKL